MNKKAMSLVTLVLTVVAMMILASLAINFKVDTNVFDGVLSDMDLKNFQQLANMAYANIYRENLTVGTRRELTADEIRTRMIKDGANEQELESYHITVKNGDVFVTPRGK